MSTARSPENPGETAAARLHAGLLGVVSISLVFLLAPAVTLAAPTLMVGLLSGALAALSCRRILDSAVAAFVAVPLSTGLASTTTLLPWAPARIWLVAAVVYGTLAAMVAAAVRFLRDRKHGDALVAGTALAFLVSAMALRAFDRASQSEPGTLPFLEKVMSAPPSIGKGAWDQDLYRDYVWRMRAGRTYYDAAAAVVAEVNQTDPGRLVPRAPATYRPPTLYWLLARLPSGTSILMATLVCGSMASLSAYVLGRRYLVPPLAVVAAAGVAETYAVVASSWMLFETEIWAGAFGLLGVTLLVHSREPGRHRLAWLAAAAALCAAAFRELAIAYIILGLVATLVTAEDRRARRWHPWVVALAGAAALQAAHAAAVADATRGLGGDAIVQMVWFHPDGSGLTGALGRHAMLVRIRPTVAWMWLAFAALGSLAAPRDWPSRVALAGVVIGGALVLSLFHPTGINNSAAGLACGYWGNTVLPTLLASVPLALTLVPGAAAARHARTGPAPKPVGA